jgi:hypothetical protein
MDAVKRPSTKGRKDRQIVTVSAVRFRRPGSRTWELYPESLTVIGATSFAKSLELAGCAARVITVPLTAADLVSLAGRTAAPKKEGRSNG